MMLKILLLNEVKLLLKSRRVLWSISIFLILFAVIFSLRVNDFKLRNQNYISDVELVREQNQEAQNYSFLGVPVVKKPKLTSIYHEGYTHAFGTFIKAQIFQPIFGADNQTNSKNKVYDFPVRMDITYLVTFFLSLFVLIITFDTVNGEKEKGMLRMIFVYPIQRLQFVLKKALGTMLFVGIVFGLPYLLSVIYIIIAFNNLVTSEFVIFFIFYFIYSIMYLFVIALIGILLSILTKSSSRSLVYSLLFWIIFSIIIPISYDYASIIINKPEKQKQLYEKRMALQDKRLRHRSELPDDKNPINYGHTSWNGGYLHNITVFGQKDMYKGHREYLKYYYKNYYPILKQEEQIKLEELRLKHNHERLRPILMFFNPYALYSSAAESIAMTSYKDYLNYLSNAINIRDKLTKLGIEQDWLFSNEYFCVYQPDIYIKDFKEYLFDDIPNSVLKENFPRYSLDKKGKEKLYEHITSFFGSDEPNENVKNIWTMYSKYRNTYNIEREKFTFEIPDLPNYERKQLNIIIILRRTLPNLILLLFISSVLLICLKYLFGKFDLR